MKRRHGWGALVAATVVVGAPVVLEAQPTGRDAVPAVFDRLEGAWEGTGRLMGRPGAFEMTWEHRGGAFVGLEFRNALVADDGTTTPVLAAQALYRFEGEAGLGAWLDDRPAEITIRVLATDSTVVSEWVAESEEGRTEYLVRSDDEVRVRDWVYTPDGEELFGEAVYRRVR